jgi:hypothetical protein
MTTELPIACSLSAGDLNDRLAEIAGVGRDALLETELAGDDATLHFADGPGVRQRLDRIVAAESECCAFLTMAIRAERDALALTISVPEGAEIVLQELVDAFRRDGLVAR